MKMRKLISSAIAFCAVFAFTSFAFAANHVSVKTTIPNIPRSACDQAGTITLELDNGTVMEEGDVIQFTLNSDVTVCKAIDYFIALADDGTDTINTDTAKAVSAPKGQFWVGGTAITPGADAPGIAAVGTSNLVIDGSPAVVGFQVKAAKGSAIVTMTLGYLDYDATLAATDKGVFKARNTASDFNLTVTGLDADERLTIKLFDGKGETVNTAYLREFKTGDKAGSYQDLTLDEADNALCIETTDFAGDLVRATPDSIVGTVAYKLGFDGTYDVANVSSTDNYYIQSVCKDACPTVLMAEATDQFGVSTKPGTTFSPGTYDTSVKSTTKTDDRWASVGTCDLTKGNGIILRRGENFTPNQKFTVKLELLVDGVAANAEAVSWNAPTGTSNVYYVSSSDSGRCSAKADPMVAGTAATWGNVSGSTNDAIIETILTAGSNHDSFILDIPTVKFDYEKVVAGAKVEVKVSFGKSPCGGTQSETFCLATFVSKCVSQDTYSLLYPYATGASDAGWWTGVVVTNTSSDTSTVAITLYDTEGGSGSLNTTIAAKSQKVMMLSAITSDPDFKAGTKALDLTKPVQISVAANTSVDGLLLLGSADGNLMHGYLPRVLKNNNPEH